jgi:ribosomal protein S15P/S13E
MKEADTTFAHTTNILSDMESYGLIRFASEGRMKYVKLTITGKELARSLRSGESLLDGKGVLKKLANLEKSIDRLEAHIKSDIKDEKSERARSKRFYDISGRWTALEAEAARYNNDRLARALSRTKERLDYLETKIRPHETIPQDT